MGSLMLATGAGAGEGLETLLTRMREEERLAEAQKLNASNIANTQSEISTRNSTTARANATADIANKGAQLKLDTLSRVMGSGGDNGGGDGQPGTQVEIGGLSMPGSPGTGSAPPASTGMQRLNNPQGRASLEIAGLHPNDMFGAVPQPPKPKGPEDFNAEETFYNGLAKKDGFPDYKAWASVNPDKMMKARHQWAEQAFTPLQSSPPVVVIGDPNAPGGTRYATRDQAVGQPGPYPADQREKVTNYNTTLDLVDEIERLGDKTGWKGLGPIAGRVGSLGKEYLGIGSDDEEALRNKINALMANASFEQGGKTLTGTEKALIDSFLAGVNKNPAASRVRLQSFRESALRSLKELGADRTKAPSQQGAATGGGGGDDLYQQYLKRHGGGS